MAEKIKKKLKELRIAHSKIKPIMSFPRKRESSGWIPTFMGTISGSPIKSGMTKKAQFFYWLILIIVTVFTYGRWFLPGDLTWGDWQTWSGGGLADWQQFNIWWDQTHTLGQSIFDIGSALWAPFFWLAGWLARIFDLPFSIISKLLWFGPFVLLSLISMPFFWRTFFPQDQHGWFWATLLYSFNTYLLLIAMGGHISVAIVYVLAPLLIAATKKALQEKNIFWPLFSAFLWVIASYYEIRIVTIVIFLTLAIILWQCITRKVKGLLFSQRALSERTNGERVAQQENNDPLTTIRIIGRLISLTIWYSIALIIAHLWWLIPFLLQEKTVTLPTENLRVDRSYLDFLHTLLLYHSQWPDNVLGKINPIAPIFVLIPVIIIFTLWFSFRLKYHFRLVALFVLLYLGGAFLAKGSGLPFGALYQWLFDHLPLFKLFRDSSKFLLIIAFSASVLWGLGFGIWQKNVRFSRVAFGSFLMIAFLFLGLWLPAANSSFRGTFARKNTPQEYQALNQKLVADDQFYRTIWLPRYSRFSYFSSTHPRSGLVDLTYHEWKDLVPKAGEVTSFFQNPISQFLFNTASIKYLAVPSDNQNDIYKDYEPKQTYRALADQVPWLTKIADKEIILYENLNFRPKITVSDNLTALNQARLAKKILAEQKDLNRLNFVFFNQKQTRLDKPRVTDAWAGLKNIQSQSNNQLIAELVINEPGVYRLIENQSSKIKINGQDYNPQTGMNLEVGRYSVIIEDEQFFGQKRDLLADWAKVAPCIHTRDTSAFNQVVIEPTKPISLSSNGQLSCLAFKIDNLASNRFYRLILDSEINGENLDGRWEILTEIGDYQSLDVTQDSAEQTIIFKTAKKTNRATLFFRLNGKQSHWQLNQVDLLGPLDLTSAREAFIFKKDSTEVLPTKIDFTTNQINSSRYQVKFKNVTSDFYLSLGTNFHPDWQAKVTANQGSQITPNHLMINGWANGWYIRNRGDFVLELQFLPELIFQKTKWVSLGWMILLSILLILSSLMKNRKIR